ncbi:MAG: hypothetical protein ACK5WS_00415 [Alphaproteobacteria bacterium]|jgi:hypothetical protein|nr:hypothetical protein [Candidatus Jidaibacter sp.]
MQNTLLNRIKSNDDTLTECTIQIPDFDGLQDTDDIKDLIEAMHHNTAIKKFIFACADKREDIIIFIANMLKINRSVKDLNILSVLDPDLVEVVSDAIIKNKGLESLHLPNLCLENDGLDLIFRALNANKRIEILELSVLHNANVDPTYYFHLLADLLGKNHIKALKIYDSLERGDIDVLIDALKNSKSLEKVEFFAYNGDIDLISKIIDVISNQNISELSTLNKFDSYEHKLWFEDAILKNENILYCIHSIEGLIGIDYENDGLQKVLQIRREFIKQLIEDFKSSQDYSLLDYEMLFKHKAQIKYMAKKEGLMDKNEVDKFDSYIRAKIVEDRFGDNSYLNILPPELQNIILHKLHDNDVSNLRDAYYEESTSTNVSSSMFSSVWTGVCMLASSALNKALYYSQNSDKGNDVER